MLFRSVTLPPTGPEKSSSSRRVMGSNSSASCQQKMGQENCTCYKHVAFVAAHLELDVLLLAPPSGRSLSIHMFRKCNKYQSSIPRASAKLSAIVFGNSASLSAAPFFNAATWTSAVFFLLSTLLEAERATSFNLSLNTSTDLTA